MIASTGHELYMYSTRYLLLLTKKLQYKTYEYKYSKKCNSVLEYLKSGITNHFEYPCETDYYDTTSFV